MLCKHVHATTCLSWLDVASPPVLAHSNPKHTCMRVTLCTVLPPMRQGLTTTTNKYDAAHRRTIGNLAKERNAELDRANAELAAFKEKYEQLQMQYAGANSRRKILEDEVGRWEGSGWCQKSGCLVDNSCWRGSVTDYACGSRLPPAAPSFAVRTVQSHRIQTLQVRPTSFTNQTCSGCIPQYGKHTTLNIMQMQICYA